MKFLNRLLVVLCLALAGVIIAMFVTEDKSGGVGKDAGAIRVHSDRSTASVRSPVREEAPPSAEFAASSSGSPANQIGSVPSSPSKAEWAHPKEWYCNVCNSIKKNVRIYMEGPYSYDRSLANKLLTLANSIERNVYSSTPDVIENQCRQLGLDYKQFQEGCSWRSGVRHPKYLHVVSGPQQNSWSPESGWEFVNPGTSDLSVRKAKVACRCNACRGAGHVVVKSRCPNCGGRGRVENTAAIAAQTAVDLVGMFAKKGRRRSIPTGPRMIPCSNCQGRGQIQTTSQCGTCGGSGQVLR